MTVLNTKVTTTLSCGDRLTTVQISPNLSSVSIQL